MNRKGGKDDDSLTCTFKISKKSLIISSFVSVFQNSTKQCFRILRFSRFLQIFYFTKICKIFNSLKKFYNSDFRFFFLVFPFSSLFFPAYKDQPVNLIKTALDKRDFIKRLLLYVKNSNGLEIRMRALNTESIFLTSNEYVANLQQILWAHYETHLNDA